MEKFAQDLVAANASNAITKLYDQSHNIPRPFNLLLSMVNTSQDTNFKKVLERYKSARDVINFSDECAPKETNEARNEIDSFLKPLNDVESFMHDMFGNSLEN